MSKHSTIDWGAIKRDYIFGNIDGATGRVVYLNMRKLAQKHTIADSTVRLKSSKEDWPSQRKEAIAERNEKVVERLKDFQLDTLEEKMKEHLILVGSVKQTWMADRKNGKVTVRTSDLISAIKFENELYGRFYGIENGQGNAAGLQVNIHLDVMSNDDQRGYIRTISAITGNVARGQAGAA